MPDPIIAPIEDVLDLHAFRPKDVCNLLEDYLLECVRANIDTVRIIHGKGTGQLKKTVQEFLKRSRLAISFCDAPPEAGGWGATVVKLIRPPMADVRSREDG